MAGIVVTRNANENFKAALLRQSTGDGHPYTVQNAAQIFSGSGTPDDMAIALAKMLNSPPMVNP